MNTIKNSLESKNIDEMKHSKVMYEVLRDIILDLKEQYLKQKIFILGLILSNIITIILLVYLSNF